MTIETLFYLTLTCFVILWIAFGFLASVYYTQMTKEEPALAWVLTGPFVILYFYLRDRRYMKKVRLSEEEYEVARIRKMTAEYTSATQGEAYKNIGKIQHTELPPDRMPKGHSDAKAQAESAKEILTRSTQGYFHFFVIDTSQGAGNRIVETSIKSLNDISFNSFSSREGADKMGRVAMEAHANDPELNVYVHPEHHVTLEVRTVASGSDKLRYWIDKLKDNGYFTKPL